MGSDITCWIEYDEYNDPPFSQEPDILPFSEWRCLSHAKDYPVFGALSGVRNDTGKTPLYPMRGIPENANWQLREYLQGDYSLVSWLYPSELQKALSHQGVTHERMSIEMKCVMNILQFFVSKLGDERVRFIFEIE